MFSTRFVILARIYGKKSIPPNFRPKNCFLRKKSLLFAAKTQSFATDEHGLFRLRR